MIPQFLVARRQPVPIKRIDGFANVVRRAGMPDHSAAARRDDAFVYAEIVGLHGFAYLATHGEAKGVRRGGVGVVVGDAEGSAAGHR